MITLNVTSINKLLNEIDGIKIDCDIWYTYEYLDRIIYKMRLLNKSDMVILLDKYKNMIINYYIRDTDLEDIICFNLFNSVDAFLNLFKNPRFKLYIIDESYLC